VLQAQAIVVTLLPLRWSLQVPELPVAMALGAYFVKFFLFHIQVLLPLVMYHRLKDSSPAAKTA
jgi:hypothetical protein